MKKTALLLLLLLCCLLGLLWPAEARAQDAFPDLTEAESLEMASFMQKNRALLQGWYLYTLDYDSDARPVLARYRLYNGHAAGYTVLAEACVPQWLCQLDGRLYYINQENGGVLESVAADGSDRQYIRAGPCSWLSTRDGLLYYCREDGRFCSMVPGATVESVLVDDRCFYAYLLDSDTLLYQSDSDGERLHLRSLSSGADRALTEGVAYAPLVWGGRLWYTGADGLHSQLPDGSDRRGYALPPLSGAAELLPWGQSLWVRGLTEDGGLRQWSASLTGDGTVLTSAERGYRLCEFQSARYRVDALYQLDGRVRGFVLTDFAGNTLRYYMGQEK